MENRGFTNDCNNNIQKKLNIIKKTGCYYNVCLRLLFLISKITKSCLNVKFINRKQDFIYTEKIIKFVYKIFANFFYFWYI